MQAGGDRADKAQRGEVFHFPRATEDSDRNLGKEIGVHSDTSASSDLH